MYLITNGKIVTENGILEDYDVLIEEDKIKAIQKSGTIKADKNVEIIDANQGYVSPGFIDIHSDYIETMAVPRPTAMMDFNVSIRETEKILINQGITTMFHSLSLYKHDEFSVKPIRNPENVSKFVDIIEKTHNEKHLVRHRFHARFEIDNIEGVDALKKYINERKVHLISFMDHTPGQGQYRNIEIYRETLKGYRELSEKQLDDIIEDSRNKEKITMKMIEELAGLARENGIAIASHDDDSIEKLNFVKGYGTAISEFPIDLDIAKSARSKGMFTLAGAPNILLGRSHSGNLSAAEAIQNNAVNVLCSDYYPAAMLHAVFILNEKYGLDLCEMFKLVTVNAAKAVNLDNIIGSIEENKKADIIIIEKIDGGFPVVTSAFVDGKLILRMNYRI